MRLKMKICAFSKNEEYSYALIGDFNTKTGSLADYIIPDDTINSIFNLDEDQDIISYLYDYVNVNKFNIPLSRVTKCTCKPNSYGHKLLSICKKMNIYIVNSRVGTDRGIGKKNL